MISWIVGKDFIMDSTRIPQENLTSTHNCRLLSAGIFISVGLTYGNSKQCNDIRNFIRFKVDIRFIFDLKDYEFDIANADIALPDADDIKTKHDKSKLFREGMINNEGIYHFLKYTGKDLYTCIIEINEHIAIFSTVLCDEAERYMAVPQFEVYFPPALAT